MPKQQRTEPQRQALGRAQPLIRGLGVAATVAAAALVVTLALRPIGGHDIGYHLACGEHLLDRGQIVQDNRFIYTRLDPAILSDRANLGPGCRYDAATNIYSYVNVNWLSQVVLASVHRAGGFVGLTLLQAAMVAATFALLVVAMRRGGVAWTWSAPALLLAALTAHERFALRPELFGYLALAGQFALLVGPGIGWRRAAGVIALQVLAVNCHSYFLLGPALAAAMFAGELLRCLWARFVSHSHASGPATRLRWYGVAAGGAVLACLCSPWFVRGALMPIQTLVAIAKGQMFRMTVGTGPQQQVLQITELSSPFLQRWRGLVSTRAYFAALGLVGPAAVVAAVRRRWGWLLVLAGMTAASVTMRRNIALAGIIAVPLAAIVLADGWAWLSKRLRPGRLGRLIPVISAAVAVAAIGAAGLAVRSVISHDLYFSERSRGRFGLGMLKVSLPVAAADWINRNQPAGRVFCDVVTSVNLMYLTYPRREVPISWACPPYVRQWVLDCTTDPQTLEQAVAEYDVGTVVLSPSRINRPVVRYLTDSPRWAVVEVDAKYVVFLYRERNESLAGGHEITEASLGLDVGRHIGEIARTDPVPAHAIHTGAMILFWMGWLDPAQAMWAECARRDGTFHEAIYFEGVCLGWRGDRKRREGQRHLEKGDYLAAAKARNQAASYYRRALRRIEEALAIKDDYREARTDHEKIRQRLASLE